MPKRFTALAALLLAMVVCLVLVLPQVDLNDGVLRDVQNQSLLLMMLALAGVILLLPPELFRHSQQGALQEDIPLETGVLPNSILRC